MRLKLPHTVLHTKHKIKQGLTTVVALQLFTHVLNRENSVSSFIKIKKIVSCLNLQESEVS